MSTLEELLAELDLSKFAPKFKEEDIDLSMAKTLSEEDLAGLGLTLGARRKLHAALHNAGGAQVATTTTATPSSAGTKAPAAAAAAAAPPPPPPPPPPLEPIKNITAFRWLFNGQRWQDYAGSGGERFRMEDSPDPHILIVPGQREVQIFDIESGVRIAKAKQSIDGADADFNGDIIVSVGGDSHAQLSVLSVGESKEKNTFSGLNEGGLRRVALVTSASGAPLAAAGSFTGPLIRLFDVNTCAPAGKIVDAYEGYTNAVIRDPLHPGCFMVSTNDEKIFYCDARASKRVKVLPIGGGRIRFPSTSNGRYIVAAQDKPARVVDSGTGRVVHNLRYPIESHRWFGSVAMYSNVAVCFGNDKYFFFDLDKAGLDTNEPVHELSGGGCEDLDMSAKVVIALSGSFKSMGRA